MSNKEKLPQLLIPKIWEPYPRGIYLVKIDPEQKEKHYFKKNDGSTGMLYVAIEYNGNHRLKHPNYGTIVKGYGDVDFPPGTEVICNHFTFANHKGELQPLWTDSKGEDHYKAWNNQVYFGIIDGELVPRKGNILCEAVVDKIYETALELPDSMVEGRRDVVKVLRPWDGCDFIKEGDYLLVDEGGDYIFEYQGKEYIKVDYYFDDILAVIPDKNTRKTKVKRHAKDHKKQTLI